MNRTGLKYYLRALGIGIIVTALLMGFSQKGQARMTDEEIRQRAAQLGMTESQGVLAELATAPSESGSTDNLLPPVEDPAGIGTEPASTAEPAEEPGTGTEPASTAEPTEEPGTGTEPASTAEPTEEPGTGTEPAPTAKPTEEPGTGTEPTSTAEPTEEPGTGTEPASTAEPTEEPGTGTEPTSTSEPAEEPGTDSAPTSSPAPAGDVATLVVTRGESSVTVSKNLEALGLVEDYWAFDRYLCENGYDHSISTGTYEIPMGLTGEEIARIICKQ